MAILISPSASVRPSVRPPALLESDATSIKCLEHGRFYRNPDRPLAKQWTNVECAKYYLCLDDGEVYEFKCSVGLLFDVVRQICDFKANVDNCDVTAGKKNDDLSEVRQANYYYKPLESCLRGLNT